MFAIFLKVYLSDITNITSLTSPNGVEFSCKCPISTVNKHPDRELELAALFDFNYQYIAQSNINLVLTAHFNTIIQTLVWYMR